MNHTFDHRKLREREAQLDSVLKDYPDFESRLIALQDRVWKNINASRILIRIISASAHADACQRYVGIQFYGEPLDEGGFFARPRIVNINSNRQPVVPKLYRLDEAPEAQSRLTSQIWEGITEDDKKFIARACFEKYYVSEQMHHLPIRQSWLVRPLIPAMLTGNLSIKFRTGYAMLLITSA